MIYIAFDTEFTGLKKDTTLVSIGLTTLDEKSQFYAEIEDYDRTYRDPWFIKNVEDNLLMKDLDGPMRVTHEDSVYVKGSKTYVANKLLSWFNSFEEEEIGLVTDVGHYDMVLFIDLFGGAFDLPKMIAPTYIDINQMIWESHKGIPSLKDSFDVSREELLKGFHQELPSGAKHNSLYDAIVIARLYNAYRSTY